MAVQSPPPPLSGRRRYLTETDPTNDPVVLSNRVDLVPDLVHNGCMEVNIHEAKTHFSRLLERVALGEEIIIAKAGTPVAKLVPLKKQPKKRVFGSAKGEFTVPDDFNDPDHEIEDLFYNGPILPK